MPPPDEITTLPPATVEPVEPGETMVLVAQVENLAGVIHSGSGDSGDISRAIVGDLREKLERTVAFSNIRVRSYSRVITSEEEALAAADANGAAVVIWGDHAVDEVELTIQVGSLDAFKYNQFDRELLDRTANVRVTMTNARSQSVAPQVLNVLSILHTADGNGFEVLRAGAMRSVFEGSPAPVVGNTVAAMVHRYLMTSDPDDARRFLGEALTLDASNPIIFSQYSVMYQRQNNPDQARQEALTAQRLGPPGWAMPPLLLANLAHDNTVLDLFTQAAEARPDDWFPLFFRGSIYYMIADDIPSGYALARQDLEASIALNPTANFPYVFYALLSLHEGRVEDARQAIWIVLTEFPDPSYLTRLMRATFQGTTVDPYEVVLSAFTNQTLGRYSTVLEDAQRGIESMPDDQDDLNFLAGMALCASGDYEAAVQRFSDELTIAPSFAFAVLMRADARLRLGDSAGAETDLGYIAESPLDDRLAPYVEQVRSGALGCADFFSPTAAPSGALIVPQAAAPEPTAVPETAAPAVEPVGPDETMVLVAEIEPLAGVEPRDVTRFIAESLTRSFEEEIPAFGLRVRRYPAIITSNDEARAIAEQFGATVIVWGTYAAEGIELEVQVGDLKNFAHIPFERDLVERSANVRVTLGNERRESIAPQALNIINILAAADGNQYEMIGALMYGAALQLPGAEIAGNSVAARIHRALLLFNQDTAAATAELDAALLLDSSNPLIYAYRGIVKLRGGQVESGASDIETARRLGPTNWALPLYMSGDEDIETALNTYAQIVALRPDDWFVYFMRGIAYYYNQNDLDAARADLDQAIALQSQTALPYIPAIMIALRQGRMNDAQTLMREMLTSYPDPSLTTRAMTVLYGESGQHLSTGDFFAAATNLVLGQYDQVIADAQPILAALAENPPTHEQLDQIGYEMMDAADLLTMVGLSYCNLGDYPAAVQAYQYALAFSPEFELVYLLLGQAQQAAGDNTGAQQSFAHASVNVLGDEFEAWVKAGMSGEWSCENLLEYDLEVGSP
jgi:tetratricopeptide (TPR) repeat protein